jgi:hypothetical protein
MKKFFMLGAFCIILFSSQVSFAGDTNVWLDIEPAKYMGTNCLMVTVYYPTNFLNWRLEVETSITGDYWREVESNEVAFIEIGSAETFPCWKQYYVLPGVIGRKGYFRAKGFMVN